MKKKNTKTSETTLVDQPNDTHHEFQTLNGFD